MIEIVPATVRHIGPIAHQMRAIDRLECQVFGHTPKQALRIGMTHSVQAATALLDGRPVAMFGVTPINLLAGHGRPWLLSTDAVIAQGVALCVGANRYLSAASRVFRQMDNWVAADNAAAIRWLMRLGFVLGDTININGVAMCYFEWRKADV